MSALPLNADIKRTSLEVRFVPNAEVALFIDQRVAAGISNLVSTRRLIDLPLQADEGSCGNQSAPTLREDDLYRQTGRFLTNPKLPVRRSEAESRRVNL